MKHYICTGGCGGESAAAGVCQAEACKKEGEPLLVCDCPDSTHAGIAKKNEEQKETESDL